MNRKKLPIAAVIAIDCLLFATVLCIFCYFHHIRTLWGIDVNTTDDESHEIFAKPSRDESDNDSAAEFSCSETTNDTSDVLSELSEESEAEKYDTSGDFGKKLGMYFISDDEMSESGAILLTDNDEIHGYCKEFDISLDSETVYIGLYRSHDIFLTLSQTDTKYKEAGGSTISLRYFVYDVYVRNIDNFFTMTTSGRKQLPDMVSLAEDYCGGLVIAAVNGDYTGNTNHCLIAERNGELLRKKDYIGSDICVLYYDGTMETISPDEYDWEAIKAKVPYQIWNFGPGMLDNGSAITEFDTSAYDKSVITSHHPRTAIGYYEPGHYSLVSVDGRSTYSRGMRMEDFANLLESLGCVSAYNMDGGNSAQSYFNGEYVRASQNDAQRSLFDIICVGEVG